MAYLPTEFSEALSNIEPEADVANAKAAHEDVRAVLEADEQLQSHKIDTRLIGSYGRHVSIKRIKDVDVFSMLTEDTGNLDASSLLDYFAGVLVDEYGEEQVVRQPRSVKVDFAAYHLSVDAVPARPSDKDWEIPTEDSGWELTNPIALADLTTAMNQSHTLGGRGVYVPVVKLVRQVRRALGVEKPSGFYFEILTYHAFDSGMVSGTTHAEYLTLALEEAAEIMSLALTGSGLADPALPGQIIKTHATDLELEKALRLLRTAGENARSALLEDDDCLAALEWRTLLGKDSEGDFVFPIPSHCNEDGTRVSAVYVPGEKRVPRGTDRFASDARDS
jgi:hypothetical protein